MVWVEGVLGCGCHMIEFRDAGWKEDPSFRAYTESARSLRPEWLRISFPTNNWGHNAFPLSDLFGPDHSIEGLNQFFPCLPALLATSQVVKEGRDIEPLASLNAQSLKILAADQLDHGPPLHSMGSGGKYHKREKSGDNFPTEKRVAVPCPDAWTQVWVEMLFCRAAEARS